jgi:hypothetical protein
VHPATKRSRETVGPDYPYGSTPLVAACGDRHSCRLTALAVGAALITLALRLPVRLEMLDDYRRRA